MLALDTTSVHGSVALWRQGRCAVLRPSDPERSYSGQLPALLRDVVGEAGLVLAEVELFAAAVGPGSLTGLRVGMATVQGLAFALGRRVVGVSSLEATARLAARRTGLDAGFAGAWTDAFRGEVFTALYRVDGPEAAWDETDPPAVARPEVTAARWSEVVGGRRVALGGTAVPAMRDLLRATFGTGLRIDDEAPHLAGVVAELAAARASRGESALPHALQPLYVRRPDAELARERAGRRVDGRPASSPSS